MKRFLVFILIFPAWVFSEWDDLFKGDSDPAIAHHVNVITGHLQLFFEDAVVNGAVPLHLTRTYSSSGANERAGLEKFNVRELDLIWQMEGGWNFLPQLQLLVDPRADGQMMLRVYGKEPNGEMITYTASERNDEFDITLKPEKKSGQSFGVISGRLNSNNNILHINYKKGKAVIELANGGKRIYRGDHRGVRDALKDINFYNFERKVRNYLLQEEISPSGQRTFYEYNDDLSKIQITQSNSRGTKTYCHVEIKDQSQKPPFKVRIKTSDNRKIFYTGWSFKNQDYLETAESETGLSNIMSYRQTRKSRGASLERFTSHDNEELYIEYYRPQTNNESTKWEERPSKKPLHIDRVKSVSKQGQVIATFSYALGITDVRDCNNILTRYHYNDDELTLIEYFDESNQLYSSQRFFWEAKNLIAKAMCDAEGRTLFYKTLRYDSYDDIIEETLYGNFTGSDHYSKRYEYDPKTHLLLTEKEDSGLISHYTYLDGTDLVLTKSILNNDELLFTQEFTYDEDNLLICESTDAGTIHTEKNYERDSRSGRIIAVEDSTLRIEYTYSVHNQIIKEDYFDSEGQYRYSIHYKYDRNGRLLSKTTPSGNENRYTYSPCGDLLTSKEVGTPQKTFTYDAFHRPTSCTINGKTTYTTYNAKGLITSSTDSFGHITNYQYDAFDRCQFTIFPEVLDENSDPYHPTMECHYDLMGNTTFCKNSKGEIKRASYNVLGKPIEEIFPDGNRVRHFYQIDGSLSKTILQDDSEIIYEHDIFQRMIHKKTPLFEEKWGYSPSQLLSYTDQKGLTTTFSYDSKGKKTEENSLDRKTTYTYDNLGFIESVATGDIRHREIHNEEGAVTYKDDNGENQTFYTYDNEGRKTKIVKITSQGEAVDTVQYDEEGRIIYHQDPNGSITEIIYNGQTKTTIDPLKNILIETYDALQRLIKIEKKSPQGDTVSIEESFYDRSGNLARKVSHIYQDNKFVKQTEVHWEYDFRGLVIKESQFDKTTYNEYDLLGRLIKKILPSGVSLIHSYDEESRLSELSSSDGTIHYTYAYGHWQSPISIEDKIHQTRLERRYNLFGELVSEINDQGISFSWEYDLLGREKSYTLLDGSKIVYEYEGKHMTKVKRLSPQGKFLYEHTYNIFDTNGHVQEESLINGLGKVTTEHDLFERAYRVNSPFHEATLAYGSSGLVTKAENSLFKTKHYEYDPLKQLVKEEDKKYHFDSLGNPSDIDTNEYNQLITKFIYDLNGNPIKRLDDSCGYEYDALGRLITILYSENRKVVFIYDAYSRLQAKTVWENDKEFEKRIYLYDQEFEIGSTDQYGRLLDLKVLGLGVNHDIGGAIAIELEREVYAPLHDFTGNIIALISVKGEIVSSFDYDAFGKETNESSQNPWRFCSKRSEEGLIYFGKRFYDPQNKRWLTPDPLGFFESTNVYLYTLNSPLNRLDLFGLYSMPEKGFYFAPSQTHSYDNFVPYYRRPAELLICRSILSKTPFAAPVDVVVISGFLHNIRFTPMEKIFNRANLLNHMNEIVPTEKGTIGLITAENGINTTLNEFIINCQSLMNDIHEKTTCIALHNRSEGLINDGKRTTKDELNNRTMTFNAIQTGLFMGVIVDSLNNIQSSSFWLHVPHSEAGVLFNLGYTMLSPPQKALLQNQLIVFAVAPAEPISWRHCYEASNIFSDNDPVTGPQGIAYANNPDYHIIRLKCRSSWRETLFGHVDHSFIGTTYRDARSEKIRNLRERYRFYDSRKR